MSTRAYPLPQPETGIDPRFTRGLTYDIGKLLEAAGYPPVTAGRDIVELQLALFRFIYEPDLAGAQATPLRTSTAQPAAEPELIHAMMPDGAETPRCGAPFGCRIALFAFSVTCPKCKALLAAQLAEENGPADLSDTTPTTEPPGDAP